MLKTANASLHGNWWFTNCVINSNKPATVLNYRASAPNSAGQVKNTSIVFNNVSLQSGSQPLKHLIRVRASETGGYMSGS